MSNKSGISNQVISLPQGGGAQRGLGEKFSPDLFTGTGNFTVPITLPAGRNAFQPEVALSYSTGNGNGCFGLGWSLNIPAVSRKTSKGIPLYDDAKDIFILSGSEDLVALPAQTSFETRYRPRTEGLFALIDHRRDANSDYWQVKTKEGLTSFYGTPEHAGRDPGTVANPSDRHRVFAWKLTRTMDLFGNRIDYLYERDIVQSDGPHQWDQLYLSQIRYVDYGDSSDPQFLVSVKFTYEDRPDPFSDYRAGFEMRTLKRCSRIEIFTNAGVEILTRTYHLIYVDQRGLPTGELPHNGTSLLSRIQVEGHDGPRSERLPPLEFDYTRFDPTMRAFFPIEGALPAQSLSHPEYELADLFGNGLPDVVQINGTIRYWRNLGGGRFDPPRQMSEAPSGFSLEEPGVQLIDADGDGRIDLLVTRDGLAGFYSVRFRGQWDRRSFQRYAVAPSFPLEDPEVRLVDLDGDGVIDAIRSGARLECFFNDPNLGWSKTRWVDRQMPDVFPDVHFSDPRVKWADMSGDGLQDIVVIHDGNVEYWPNLGYGNWGKRIHTENSPRFPFGYDPARILLGDVDGDGLADIVYVDDAKVTLWINQSGNKWSDAIEIMGTPRVTDIDSVRLVDLLGNGISGVLWSSDATTLQRSRMFFLDLTGGLKPYVLKQMDNHMGAVTRIEYASSTRFYVEDAKQRETQWKTALPFPVQVVSRIEVSDAISGGKLTTEYTYHHGYWDGTEREFRGFGRVDQRDTESFSDYQSAELPSGSLRSVHPRFFSPPIETRTWFHLGPVSDELGDWREPDFTFEFWQRDDVLLAGPRSATEFLSSLPRWRKRDALRSLRGNAIRTELYGLDGTDQEDRPYTVTENLYSVREESKPAISEGERTGMFFPHVLVERTTEWERGDDPMTHFDFTDGYDEFGRPTKKTSIGVPRRAARRAANAPVDESKILATHTRATYAIPDPGLYVHDRVAQVRVFELLSPPSVIETNRNNLALVMEEQATAARGVHRQFQSILDSWSPEDLVPPEMQLISHTVNHYDGESFEGRLAGELGPYGSLTRSESLAFTEAGLDAAYRAERPTYLGGSGTVSNAPLYFGDDLGYRFEQRLSGTYHDGYYIDTLRQGFDFQDAPGRRFRGLVVATQDPIRHETTIGYDSFYLLVARVTDPVGLTTTAEYDYRVLQASNVSDANGNRTGFAFTPLGLLEHSMIRGKVANNEGDLERPSVRMIYDFLAFENRPREAAVPISVRTVRHVHHDTEMDAALPQRDDTIETVEYSDGFGRLVQTRTQSEDFILDDSSLDAPLFGRSGLPIDQSTQPGNAIGRVRDSTSQPYVVVSGWQTYDNKGRVVERYEPFFAQGWDYSPPERRQLGQRTSLHYDSRGQILRTVNPDGSEQRLIYGVPDNLTDPDRFRPTQWELYTYDENDNGGRTHSGALQAYRHHWNTPTSALVDVLGRTIETVQRNRTSSPVETIEEHRSRSRYDIRGNLLAVTDALGREAFSYKYDLLNRPLREESLDAGSHTYVLDALGKPVEQRDSKGAVSLRSYDALSRPLAVWARDAFGESLTLRELLQYGDEGDQDTNRTANRLGRPYRHFDEAGELTFESYDFKGNVLEKVRRVLNHTEILRSVAGFECRAYRVDWQPRGGMTLHDHAENLLSTTEYRVSLTYDALNRVKTVLYPEDVSRQRRLLRLIYNRSGTLQSVDMDNANIVQRIAHNAKGQRVLIAFGNRVMTRYVYEPATSRVARMRTERYEMPDLSTYHPIGTPLQDLAYEYDLVGNVTAIHDRTPGCGVINTASGPNALDRSLGYDALYRLISSTGRECADTTAPWSWTDESRCGFNSASHGTPGQDNAAHLTALYREVYSYDAAGNMVSLRHSRYGTAWTRQFGIGGRTPSQWELDWRSRLYMTDTWQGAPGNQLTHVTDDTSSHPAHVYDPNGNLISETTSRHFEWDHGNRMRLFRIQPDNATPSLCASYLYSAGGDRIMKLVRTQNGSWFVTVYIDGLFEHQQWSRGSVTRENNYIHILDDQNRIALRRFGEPHPADTGPQVQYHLGDHLGSSCLIIDESGSWINREEYSPYGETTFGSFARKRYRYIGKERDEENGLYYLGGRYYAPWLSRWVSCDPVVSESGTSRYQYVRSNPFVLIDPSGTEERLPELQTKTSNVTGENPQTSKPLTLRETKPPKPRKPYPSGHPLEFSIDNLLLSVDLNNPPQPTFDVPGRHTRPATQWEEEYGHFFEKHPATEFIPAQFEHQAELRKWERYWSELDRYEAAQALELTLTATTTADEDIAYALYASMQQLPLFGPEPNVYIWELRSWEIVAGTNTRGVTQGLREIVRQHARNWGAQGSIDVAHRVPHVFTAPGERVRVFAQHSKTNRGEGADISRAAQARRELNDPLLYSRPRIPPQAPRIPVRINLLPRTNQLRLPLRTAR